MDQIKELLKDCSDSNQFCFSMKCMLCGEEWISTPIRFSRAQVIPETEEKRTIYEILYDKEKEYARKNAIKEAEAYFNLCPVCNKIVCDQCFMICDDLDMCSECAARFREKGEHVSE